MSQPKLVKPIFTNNKIEATLADGTEIEIDFATEEEKQEYSLKLKQYYKDEKAVKTIKRSLFNVITGQCSRMMKSKLEGSDNIKKIETDADVVEYLKLIRGISRTMASNASIYDQVHE